MTKPKKPKENDALQDYLQTVVTGMENYRKRNKLPKLSYNCLEDLVFHHGESFQPADLPKSFRYMRIGRCFHNNHCLIKKNRDLTYVEGFAIATIMPVHHAWVVDQKNRVIDVTWDPELTGPIENRLYFGIKFKTQHVKDILHNKPTLSILDDEHNNYPILQIPFTDENFLNLVKEYKTKLSIWNSGNYNLDRGMFLKR